MEEMHRTPAPAEPQPAPAVPADAAAPEQDCWADLAPGALSHDPQALLAAWMAGRAMPRRTLVRRIIGAVALIGLLACFAGACRMVLEQEQASLLQLFLPFVFAYLFMLALKDLPLRFLLRRALRRLVDGTLYPDRLHLVTTRGEEDLALEDLIMVQRFKGWTVLIWGSWKHPRIVPIPDDACFGKAPLLYARLQESVTDAPFFCSPRPPRRRRHLVVGLLLLIVIFCTELLVLYSYWGFRTYTITDPNGSGSVQVDYMGASHALISDSVGTFAYPSTGELHAQWSDSGCCVVTYRATDDSLRVQMLEPTPGAAKRLRMDPPKGSWTTFLDSDDSVTLDWDATLPGYRLKTPWGTLDCPQWEQFDGMGLALCDEDGLPRWTLTPTDFPAANSEGAPVSLSGLLLCPVSMTSSNADVLLLGPADSPFLPGKNTAGDSQAANPAAPRFDDTIDVCVNESGVFFTWDGASASQALTADDCARAGIESEADLDPLVLRWDVASFLTVEDGRVCSYTSTDQGGTWQRAQLATLGSDTLTDRCCSFAGTGQGFASLSGTDSDGGTWVKVCMTLDHGASWQRITTPQSADGVLRPLNSLSFYDGACGAATAPADAGEVWPHVYTTADCGRTWVEPDIPFADSGQTGAVRLKELSHDGIDWHITLTQVPDGTREINFEGSDLTHGVWTFHSLHDAA